MNEASLLKTALTSKYGEADRKNRYEDSRLVQYRNHVSKERNFITLVRGREAADIRGQLDQTKQTSGFSVVATPLNGVGDRLMLRKTEYFRFGPRLSEKRLSAWKLKETQLQKFLKNHPSTDPLATDIKEQMNWIPQGCYSASESSEEDDSGTTGSQKSFPSLSNKQVDKTKIQRRLSAPNSLHRSCEPSASTRRTSTPDFSRMDTPNISKAENSESGTSSERKSSLLEQRRSNGNTDPGHPLDRVKINGRKLEQPRPTVNKLIKRLTEAYIKNAVQEIHLSLDKKLTRPVSAPALTTIPYFDKGSRSRTSSSNSGVTEIKPPQETLQQSLSNPITPARVKRTRINSAPESKRCKAHSPPRKLSFNFTTIQESRQETTANAIEDSVFSPELDENGNPHGKVNFDTGGSPLTAWPASINQIRSTETSDWNLDYETIHHSQFESSTTQKSVFTKKASLFSVVKNIMQREIEERDKSLEMTDLSELPQWKRQLLYDAPKISSDTGQRKIGMTMSSKARQKQLMGMVHKHETNKNHLIEQEHKRRDESKWSLVMSVMKLDKSGSFATTKTFPGSTNVTTSSIHVIQSTQNPQDAT